MDPSKACSPDSGCRVNGEPIRDFKKALKIAKRHETEARMSGKWVDTEDIKESPVTRPASGIYTFRDLQRLVLDGKAVTYDDVHNTLAQYAEGFGIIAQVAISIIRTLSLGPDQSSELRRLAEKGIARQREGKDRDEWLSLAEAI